MYVPSKGIGVILYGRANRRALFGKERIEAERTGYIPYSYQMIKWFIVLFFPVVPLGTYRVLRAKQAFWTLEAPRYNMVKVEWDFAQVARHYAIAYGWILVVIAIIGFRAG